MSAARINCPKCSGADTRKATVFWQCMTCGFEWLRRVQP